MTLDEAKKNSGKRVRYLVTDEVGYLNGNLGPDHLLIAVRFDTGRREYVWPSQLAFVADN